MYMGHVTVLKRQRKLNTWINPKNVIIIELIYNCYKYNNIHNVLWIYSIGLRSNYSKYIDNANYPDR